MHLPQNGTIGFDPQPYQSIGLLLKCDQCPANAGRMGQLGRWPAVASRLVLRPISKWRVLAELSRQKKEADLALPSLPRGGNPFKHHSFELPGVTRVPDSTLPHLSNRHPFPAFPGAFACAKGKTQIAPAPYTSLHREKHEFCHARPGKTAQADAAMVVLLFFFFFFFCFFSYPSQKLD